MNIFKGSALSTAFFLPGCAIDNSGSVNSFRAQEIRETTLACYKSHDDERHLLGSQNVWMGCNRWADAKVRRSDP